MQSYTWVLNVGFVGFLMIAYFFYYKVITFLLAAFQDFNKIQINFVWKVFANFENFLMITITKLHQFTLVRGVTRWTAQYNRLLRRK